MKYSNGSTDDLYEFINHIANKFYNNCLTSSNKYFNLGAHAGADKKYYDNKRKEYLRIILDDYIMNPDDENDKIDYIFYISKKGKVRIFDMNSEDGKNALIEAAYSSSPSFTDTSNSGKPANRIMMPGTD